MFKCCCLLCLLGEECYVSEMCERVRMYLPIWSNELFRWISETIGQVRSLQLDFVLNVVIHIEKVNM